MMRIKDENYTLASLDGIFRYIEAGDFKMVQLSSHKAREELNAINSDLYHCIYKVCNDTNVPAQQKQYSLKEIIRAAVDYVNKGGGFDEYYSVVFWIDQAYFNIRYYA